MMAVLGLVVILAFSQDAVSRIFSYITYDIFVKRCFSFEHETDSDRQDIQAVSDLVAQSFRRLKSHHVFLCGDDDLG